MKKFFIIIAVIFSITAIGSPMSHFAQKDSLHQNNSDSLLISKLAKDSIKNNKITSNEKQADEQDIILPDNLRVGLTLQNLHFWRGVSVTDASFTSIDVAYSFDKNKYWTLALWGGYAWGKESHVINTWHEIDYYFMYNTGRFMMGFWDCYNDSYIESSTATHGVFNYDRKNTVHRIDFRGFWIPSAKIPVRIEFGTTVYGWDRDPIENQNRYSSYFELGYPVISKRKVNLDVFCGTAFGLNGRSHMYGNGENDFDFVNIGFKATRNLTVFNHTIPVGVTSMWNPSSKLARIKLEVTLF